ncbi:voltage-gated potassium channel [Paenibacillus phyllosphaerae]|uniref:Voltage-gated potassium channel n=1 Tax=Paenibacillus phyllosphaerae TaxID=274593 RepID=A0A7W5AY26_9BACL|nr:potassium channel family protein [Paenibacillus phyllosphaerae]MBB3110256.1 voltage-gated potassium channel [Paenibacillus phyllosphaerae]
MILRLLSAASKLNGRWLTGTAVVFFSFSSILIHLIEPEKYTTVFKGLWWTVVTASTVGYGDYFPETIPGMILGICVIFGGLFIIGSSVGKITEQIIRLKKSKEEGRVAYLGKDHYVMIGWSSEKSMVTVQELLEADTKRDIVLIDRMAHTPFVHERFHYIQGDPTIFATLDHAGVDRCSNVMIFAPDKETDPLKADGQTLIIATSIESFGQERQVKDGRDGKGIYTIVELVHAAHERNFKFANVDEFVLSHQSTSFLMAKSSLHKGSSQLFKQLLDHAYGEDLHELQPRAGWRTYGDAHEQLKREGANLIADRKDLTIIRKLNEPIPPDARLFVICDDATYEAIKDKK